MLQCGILPPPTLCAISLRPLLPRTHSSPASSQTPSPCPLPPLPPSLSRTHPVPTLGLSPPHNTPLHQPFLSIPCQYPNLLTQFFLSRSASFASTSPPLIRRYPHKACAIPQRHGQLQLRCPIPAVVDAQRPEGVVFQLGGAEPREEGVGLQPGCEAGVLGGMGGCWGVGVRGWVREEEGWRGSRGGRGWCGQVWRGAWSGA